MTPKLLNNRYQLILALANGGFGQTFLAEDTHMPSRRRCVIKQLKPIANNPQAHQLVQERFRREAATLEKLGESNDRIPQLYAYFEEAGQFYLVQEWIEGQTLAQMVQKQGKISVSTVQDILVNLLPVLDYVHRQGIIHRDIKPDNIILRQRDSKPVLIDFGALKETMTTGVNAQGNPTHSVVIGTPGFMPSEQAAGKPVYSSDLYSLGLTAVYLLTGKWPQELGIDRQTGEFIWRQYAPSINPNLAAVLDKAIKSHPRDRYSTARQMLDALQTSPTPVSPVNPSQQETLAVSPVRASGQNVQIPTQTSGSRNWPKIAIAGSILAASIIGILLAKPRQPEPEPSVRQQTSSPAPTRSPLPPAVSSPSPRPPAPTRSPLPPVVSSPSPTPTAPTRSPTPSPTPSEVSSPTPSPSPTPSEVSSPAPSPTPSPSEVSSPSPLPPIVSSPTASPPAPSPEPSSPPETTPTPETTQTPSPTPTPTPTEEKASTSVPSGGQVPVFPVGTSISAVKQALGKPTFDKRGLWNTRAVSYENFVPGQASLGYLYDPNTQVIRETEIAFEQSVDLQVMQKTVNELLQGSAGDDINRKLERVYQGESRRQFFTTGSLKGEIRRLDKENQIYIAIWEADLH